MKEINNSNLEGNSKVEKQSYYYRNDVEVKDVIKTIYKFYGSDLSSFEASCIYNIMKYLMRYKYKEKPKQDLKKLKVNVDWLIGELEYE